MKNHRNLFLGTLVVISLSPVALADTYLWNGSTTGGLGGTNNTWDTSTANWTGAGTTWPATSTTNDDAVFGGTAGAVSIAAGGVTANELTFNTTGYTVSGAALTLDGAPVIAAGTGITATISSVISGSAGLTKAGDGILVLSGANNFTGVATVGSGTLRAGNATALGTVADGTTVSPGATLDINGQGLTTEVLTISGTGVGGNGALVNTGAEQINATGRIVLGANASIGGVSRWDLRNSSPTLDLADFTLTKTGVNYIPLVGATVTPGTGGIIINQGEFSIQTTSNMGGGVANAVTVNNGATLGMWQSSVAHDWSLNLNSGSTVRAQSSAAATHNTWSGPVAVSGEVTILAEGVLTLSNTISGTANLTKTGGNTATISGSLAHTGNITVNSGTLNLSGTNSFTGTTTVNAATLALNYSTADNSKLPDSQILTLAGGTISLTGGTHPEEVASTTLAANSSSTVSLTAHTGYLAMNTITPGAGSSINFSADAIATVANLNSNGILGPWATIADNQWAASASGSVVAFNDDVFSLDLLDDAALYQSEHVNVNSSQAPDAAISPLSLVFNTAAANTLTLQGNNTIATGGILVGSTTGANAVTITGGSITGPLDGDLVINQRNSNGAGTLAIDSTISNNGTTSLVKSGLGIVILTGSNSYTGTTAIAGGSLQINHPNAIGGTQVTTSGINSAALLLGNDIVVPATKSITVAGTGANQFYGALSTPLGYTGTSEWQGPVTIGALTGTRIGTLGGTLRVSGNIGESAAGSQLNIRNNETVAGTTILSGNNTFTGGLVLAAGNLRMASANALGNGTFSIGSGTLANAFSSDSSTPRTIPNPTALTATGTINLGNATLDGKLTFSNTVDLAATARIVSIASDVEISGTLAGSGNLTKTGVASLILSNPNANTGSIFINAGTLVAAHKDALASSLSIHPATTGGSGILRLATDESVVVNRIETSSSNPCTIVSDRATSGAGINHTLNAGWFGANTYTFAAGANVTSGTAGITFGSANLTAGSSSTATLNPTSAVLTITGPVNIGLNNHAKTLRLDGTSTGNLISGVVSNGLNTLSVLKSGSSTWELSGANSYTGTTTVRQGILTLSGARTGTQGNISVGDTAGLDATLNISNGTHNLGGGQMNVANAPTTAITATVNQTGGSVLFAAGGGNQLLVGQNTVLNRGIYNLSGGSLTIGLSTSASRGVMLGVNTGSAGGTFNLSGTGALNMTAASGGTGNATLQIGRFDSAANNTNNSFNQTGGTANIGVLSIGGNAATGTGITSTLSITGGTFSANLFPRMAAGNTNTATVTIGGTADVTLPAFPTARGTTSTATLYFDGGVLKPTADSATYISGLTNAFIRSGGANFNTNSFNITVSQILRTDPVSTGGGLTKDGSGTLTLTAPNTYTGNTTVTAGTLSLGNGTANTSLADGADVIVAASSSLNLNYSGTDTIDQLTINGIPRAAGIWGSLASGAPNTDPQLTGSGTLTVTTAPSASDYDIWAGPGGFNLSGGPGDDEDNDGLSNFEEYAFGLDPTSGSSVNPITQPLDKATGIFKYTRRATPAITGVTYTFESSTTLSGTWNPFTPDSTSSDSATPTEEITVEVPASLLTQPKLFIRVKGAKP